MTRKPKFGISLHRGVLWWYVLGQASTSKWVYHPPNHRVHRHSRPLCRRHRPPLLGSTSTWILHRLRTWKIDKIDKFIVKSIIIWGFRLIKNYQTEPEPEPVTEPLLPLSFSRRNFRLSFSTAFLRSARRGLRDTEVPSDSPFWNGWSKLYYKSLMSFSFP